MQSTKEPHLSIVTPFFNEEECVGEYYRRVSAALDELGRSYEIVAVSDGSTDGTDALLSQLAAKDSRVRPYRLSRNTGQWAALAAGIAHTRGDYIVIMDGDLQHAPEDIRAIVEKMDEGFDLVSGSRTNRTEHVLARQLPSRIANGFLRAVSGCTIRDMGGFKCLRGDIARRLNLRAGQHRLLPALVHMQGGKTGEVFVSAPPRFAGYSKYNLTRSIDVLLDIFALWMQSSLASRPVHAFGRLSLVLAGIASLLFVWVLADKIFVGTPLLFRPAFFFSLSLLVVSVGLFAFGFIVDLLADIYARMSGQTTYIARELKPVAPAAEPIRATERSTS